MWPSSAEVSGDRPAGSPTHGRIRDTATACQRRFDGDFDQQHTLNAYVTAAVVSAPCVGQIPLPVNFPIVGYRHMYDLLFLGSERNQVRLPAYPFDLSRRWTFVHPKPADPVCRRS